jgi:hypothetical protein
MTVKGRDYMKRTRTTLLWLAVLLLLLAFAADVVCAATVTVSSVPASTTAAGWRRGNVGAGSKNGLTYFGAYGNPGPAPIGHFYLQDGYTYDTAGEGQSWLGTNDYAGVRISNITTLKYWGWLERRGPEFQEYCVEPECTGSNQQFGPKWWPTQPPKPILLIDKDGTGSGTALRMLMYRPWDFVGPDDGRYLRKWREYDCLYGEDVGVWYVVWDNTDLPAFTGLWSDILDWYPNATIASQAQIPDPANSKNNSAVDAGVNIELGALATYNSDMDPWAIPGYKWWQEGYNAKGAVDLITIGVSGSETTYNFDSTSYVYRTLGTSNMGLTGATFNYCKFDPPSSSEYTCWRAAVQRAAQYNYVKFVTWGRVCYDPAPDSGTFWIDDGTGKNIQCYCYGNTVAEGDLLRVAGFYAAPTPYDWGMWFENECDCNSIPPTTGCHGAPYHWFCPPATPVLNTYSWDILTL